MSNCDTVIDRAPMKKVVTSSTSALESLTVTQLQTLLSGINEALMVIQADTLSLVTLNDAATQLLGMPATLRYSSKWLSYLPPFTDGETHDEIALAPILSSVTSPKVLELHVTHSRKMYELSAQKVALNGHGFIVCKFREITHRLRRREQTLRFIHSIGHELKQPLGLIRAYTYYIKKNLFDIQDQIQQYPEKINQQVDIITSMLNNIVDTTKLSTALINLNLESIDLNLLLTDVITDLTTAYPDRTFRQSFPKSAVVISGDVIRIREAILNVMLNAIKYSDNTQPIKISLTKKDFAAVIKVKDYGIGIPAEQLEHIFEPYFRTDHSKVTGVKGLGLGLALVREIIKLHSGSITVESKLNKGSTFSITLPAITKNNFQ